MAPDPALRKSGSLESKLTRYSALAGAATMAGGAAPVADAAIVHVTGSPVVVGLNDVGVPWNIDGAGGDEFIFNQFFAMYSTPSYTSYICTQTEGGPENCVGGYTITYPGFTTTLNSLYFTASAYGGVLTEGSSNTMVSTADGFTGTGWVTFFSNAQPPFVDGAQTIGFQFGNPPLHGWANIVVGTSSLLISEWAYEDSAAVAIGKGDIPEPSSMVLLAAGAAGFGLYRRRRRGS